MKPSAPIVPARSTARVPTRWRKEVERILIPQSQIARRVRQMSNDIEREFKRREMVVVSLLNGTVMFLADLIRNLSLPLRLDVRGRDVLLVDDILDTGKTLYRVLGRMRALKPRRIRTCVLLNKPARRIEEVQPDFVGFNIPDFFVVGYGLDFAERYRNLPFVGVLHPHIYKMACQRINAAGKKSATSKRKA